MLNITNNITENINKKLNGYPGFFILFYTYSLDFLNGNVFEMGDNQFKKFLKRRTFSNVIFREIILLIISRFDNKENFKK